MNKTLVSTLTRVLPSTTLWVTVLVILWGALVRATGSGAGCGDHWPSCQGTMIPELHEMETFIEFFHRVTSGLVLMLSVALWWTLKKNPLANQTAKSYGRYAMIFMIIEALIGAGLVLLQLVENNSSYVRGLAIGMHLANTLFLLATIVITVQATRFDKTFKLTHVKQPGLYFFYIFVCMIGAIVALGDTLFISSQAITDDHIFVKLRAWHPVLAITLIIWLGRHYFRMQKMVPRLSQEFRKPAAKALTVSILGPLAQILIGALSVKLAAPVYMQLIHLLVANIVWVALVQLAFWEGSAAHLSQCQTSNGKREN